MSGLYHVSCIMPPASLPRPDMPVCQDQACQEYERRRIILHYIWLMLAQRGIPCYAWRSLPRRRHANTMPPRICTTACLMAALIMLPTALHAQAPPIVPDNPMIEAARRGDVKALERALFLGYRPNERGRDRIPAVMIAARRGHYEAVEFLLEQGARPDYEAFDGGTSLTAAAHQNRRDIVELLLQHGAKPNKRGLGQETALIIAVRAGFAELAELLLKEGADPLFADLTGRNALDWAELKGDARMLRVLKAPPQASPPASP